LIALKELVDEDITHIKNKLDVVKTELITKKIYANPDWYRRATAAKRIKGQLSQCLQNEIAQRKRERKARDRELNEKDRIGYLLEAMKQVLTPEQVEKVLDMWRQLRP